MKDEWYFLLLRIGQEINSCVHRRIHVIFHIEMSNLFGVCCYHML